MVTCTRLIALAPNSFGCSVIMAYIYHRPFQAEDILYIYIYSQRGGWCSLYLIVQYIYSQGGGWCSLYLTKQYTPISHKL